MKFQQILTNFINFRTNYFCRMCFANSINKNNINFDIVTNDRYYHETIYIRTEKIFVKTINIENMLKRIIKTQREIFFSLQNMLIKVFAF